MQARPYVLVKRDVAIWAFPSYHGLLEAVWNLVFWGIASPVAHFQGIEGNNS